MSIEERLAYLEGAYAQIADRFADEVQALQVETSRRLNHIEHVVRRQS